MQDVTQRRAMEASEAESMATVRRIVGELLQTTNQQQIGGRALRPGDLARLRAIRTADTGDDA